MLSGLKLFDDYIKISGLDLGGREQIGLLLFDVPHLFAVRFLMGQGKRLFAWLHNFALGVCKQLLSVLLSFAWALNHPFESVLPEFGRVGNELLFLDLMRKVVQCSLDLFYSHSQKLKFFGDFTDHMFFMFFVKMVIFLWEEFAFLNLLEASRLQKFQEILLNFLFVCWIIEDVIEEIVEDDSADFLHKLNMLKVLRWPHELSMLELN